MLKQFLLASAVLISTPALAQTVPGDAQTVPPPADTTAPVPDPNAQPAPAPAPAAPAPAPAAPAPDPNAQAGPPAPAPAPAAPDPNAQAGPVAPAGPPVATAGPAPAPAPAAGAQIAEVVNAEFATYDKNGNGSLNKTEFSSWMTALRTKADPNLKDDAANKAWVAQAFGQADADKSKSVSKDELTNFLAQGPKAS